MKHTWVSRAAIVNAGATVLIWLRQGSVNNSMTGREWLDDVVFYAIERYQC